jgi:hypothetical protein
MKWRATGISSETKDLNQKLDLQILKQEPPDEITRAAPWYQRLRIATAYSTIASVVRGWFH